MSSQPIRVMIADDHPVVLDGLTTLLSANATIAVVGIARSFEDLFELLERVTADILILDIGGMGGSPLTVVHRIQRHHPAMKIIVFSSSIDLAPQLLQAGVSGYIAKEDFTDQLIAAVHAVASGQPYLAGGVADYLAQTTHANKAHRLTGVDQSDATPP